MTTRKDKYIFYLTIVVLTLLLIVNVISLIKYILIDDNIDKEHLIALLITLLFVDVLIILLSVVLRRCKKDIMRDNYITNIVHDCKTPITTISLICQTLNDIKIDSDESLRYYSDILETESSRLIIMIENVLNLLRLNNVTLDLNKLIDVHNVIVDIVSSLMFVVNNLDGKIITSFNSVNSCVKGNYDVLVSIFTNILSNAIKYSESSPKIMIETRNVDDSIEISIIDNGIGIEEKELKNIFDKTYRIPSSNGSSGFGLGLYYVNENIKKLNGKIVVKSSFGNGSEFRISLPIVK